MVPSLFSGSLPALEEVVNFAQARHSLLAGNIANMNTPGYQIRDLSVETFQQHLKEALDARGQTADEPLTPGVVPLRTRDNDPLRQVRDSLKNVQYHDKTDMNLEMQVTEIAKNQYMHDMAIAVMSSQFRVLQTAISERV